MTKILILGGYGQTGRPLARHLLRQSPVELVIAGRSLEKADAFAAQLNAEFPGAPQRSVPMPPRPKACARYCTAWI